jgi:hypothetical protein
MISRTLGVMLALACWPMSEALVWSTIVDEWVSGIAIEQLPDSVPEFIRTPQGGRISRLRVAMDRSRDADKTHDAERNPGHYINLEDNGNVVGVLPLSQLPTTREDTTRFCVTRASRSTKRGISRTRSSTVGSSERISPIGAH